MIMLRWAIIFAILSLILGLVGFTGAASAFAGIAKLLFFLTIAIFAVLLALGLMAGKSAGR
jgi:uncharacterized membrane protein YtjA (UPF0391 family)